MKHLQNRSQSDIDLTRRELEKFKTSNPDTVFALVADIALGYADPLQYWGEVHGPDFIAANARYIREQGAEAIYEKHRGEIDYVAKRCLASPLGGMTYDVSYVVQVAIENRAFLIRDELTA